MELTERIRLYVSKCPPGTSGEGGHSQTYTVAVSLVHGFALSEAEALPFMREYNQTCKPPWNEQELAHKLHDAATKPHNKPRGYLLNGHQPHLHSERPRTSPKSKPMPTPRAPEIEIPDTRELPTHFTDATRRLLRACFQPDEGVRIVPAALGDDGKEIPEGKGPTLSCSDWLRKLDAHDGNPNRIWSQSNRAGIYIGINPLIALFLLE